MSYRNYYDTSSYSRPRDTGRSTSNISSDRPTTVTAKYINSAPSYKSSSIPVLSNDRSAREETPISAIANRYANYNKPDKSTSKYDKKDYTSKLTVPSTVNSNKSRDVSPVSTSSKYSISRSTRHISPDRRTTKTLKDKTRDPSPVDRDREKHIPSKTDKSGYSGLSSYKLYSRTPSYNRPASRTETKPEVTVNRYAIANRLSSSYLRSPTPVKRASLSPVSYNDTSKSDNSTPLSPSAIEEEDRKVATETRTGNVQNGSEIIIDNNEDIETVSVVTRHTSPTPPGSSSYVRSRRADMAKTVEKIITRAKKKPEMIDKEIQSDRLDDPTRSSRFGSTSRTSITNWTFYAPSSTNYTGYAGRYSTQYSNLRDNSTSNSYDRSSRSRSREPISSENSVPYSHSENSKDKFVESNNTASEINGEEENIFEQNKNEDTPDIVINVNLKLNKAKSPVNVVEIAPPEITVTNSQLPPQAPKTDAGKTKKLKVRKSSTDSSTDSSSKKKVLKKRSKSVSSTDSDPGSEKTDKENTKESKSSKTCSSKSSTGINTPKSSTKSKHSKSRESNSPESSITLSTQSSISEDESISKSKTNDVSRTSADELSISMDRSGKQASPVNSNKNEAGTEEAKSFLIRALAPVTNLFKLRHQDSSENSRWLDSSTSESTGKDISNLITETGSSKSKSGTDNIVASSNDNVVKLKAIRHIESGERAWWLDSETDKKSQSSDKIRRLDTNIEQSNENHISQSIENSDSKRPLNKCNYQDDEKPWWLDSSANIPEGIERLTPPRKSSSDSDKSEKFNFFKVRHIESGEKKDWWLTSNENSSNSNKIDSHNSISLSKSGSDQRSFPLKRIRHIESGERPWWLASDKNIPEGIEKLPTPPPQDDSDSSDSEEVRIYVPSSQIPPFPLHLPDDEPLGDRRSPEGLETPKTIEEHVKRRSPYENNRKYRRGSSTNLSYQKSAEKYISRYTDIDDILGTSGQIYSPFMDSLLARRVGQISFDDDECEEIDPTQVRIHDSTPQMPVIKKLGCRTDVVDYREEDQLDDATLQVFKDGDYGPYLDLDSTLGEQDEELEGLQDSRKNALVLRTQLSVRVHAIIERLLHSQGRELRRALFTLKQILQSDKDLVHEFVANKGLDCLMQVSNMADHNYLDYILRALGQILLYVDGMHGVMNHKRCIQWLYSLISSKFRHVVKTALKLLLVFVEYTEKNSLLLIDAITVVDNSNGRQPWYNVMKILQDFDASDTELLIYATTLINRCLNNVPDRDTYYDQVDALQDQGMDDIIQLYMSKQGTDLDLLRQLQIFEAVLLYEDGDETGTALKQLDDSVINSVRRRSLNLNTPETRKSKKKQMKEKAKPPVISHTETESKIANNNRTQFLPSIIDNKDNKDLSTALRRKRDRYTRQAHHIEFLNNSSEIYKGLFGHTKTDYKNTNGNYSTTNGNHITANTNGTYAYYNGKYSNCNGVTNEPTNYESSICSSMNGHTEDDKSYLNRSTKTPNLADVLKNGNQRYTAGLKQRIQNGTLGHSVNAVDTLNVIRQKQLDVPPETKDDRGIILNREHSIKDLAQRLTTPISPTSEEKPLRVTDVAGIVSKAKAELAKSQSKEIIKSPTIEKTQKIHEIKVSENDLHWEELKKGCLDRAWISCHLDFSDLRQDSDDDMLSPVSNAVNGPPPPPPGMFPGIPGGNPPPLPAIPGFFSPTPRFPDGSRSSLTESTNDSDSSTIKKNKKTVKLFWREIQDNPIPPFMRSKVGGFIWDELPEVSLNTAMLEHLFESRTNDLILKEKLMEPKRNLILDAKRSNAINIAMKKLPTPQTIKAAIMKMDATVIGREGIEKLLTMLPTEEEKIKIQEAQYANPDLPLGSAEQFLLTLASINELSSRLKLWVFKLDFDNLEKEIAEPLMDLKQGIELLKDNRTFKVILATLRSVGSFLNGSQPKGFRLEYLSKVMEVKDTVHKHPLLYHLCEMIIEKFPDSTDFFTEVGPVIRASKVDFDMVSSNLLKLESDCKASWDHMKRVAKHDSSQIFKTKIDEFLTDAAERIILLNVIKQRVMNRYAKFLLYYGIHPGEIPKNKPSDFLKVIAEFALEYHTTRERVLQQLEKRANHRERNKTRGKMIIDVGNYSNKNGDHAADSALKELLKTDPDTYILTDGRRKSQVNNNNRRVIANGDLSADDEIIESLVRSATAKRKPIARDRRRNRLSDKKNLNRTLDGHQSWPGRENNEGSTADVEHR